MLPILCLFVTQFQGDLAKEPPSLYQAVVKKSNPQNGYEDFLLAMDSLKTGNFRPMRANLENDKKGSLLLGRKNLTDRFSYAINIVRAGLKKQIFNPQDVVEPTTGFPEIAWMDDITYLFLAEAYVRHASGNPLSSLQSYFDAYEFNCAIQRSGPMEPFYGGIDSKKRILVQLVANLPRFTIPELIQIEKWAQARLNTTDLLSSLHFEIADMEGKTDNVVSGKWRKRTDQENSLLQQLGSLKFGEQNIARGQIEKDTNDALARWKDMLGTPESNWSIPEFPEYTKFGGSFVQNMNLKIVPSVKALSIERSKLRMIIVACRLYTYKWSFEKLPVRIGDAVEPALAVDPLSGQPFNYEGSVTSGVKLSSLGSRFTGPISLTEGKIE